MPPFMRFRLGSARYKQGADLKAAARLSILSDYQAITHGAFGGQGRARLRRLIFGGTGRIGLSRLIQCQRFREILPFLSPIVDVHLYADWG